MPALVYKRNSPHATVWIVQTFVILTELCAARKSKRTERRGPRQLLLEGLALKRCSEIFSISVYRAGPVTIAGLSMWLSAFFIICPPTNKEGNAHDLWPMKSKQPNTIDVGRAMQQHVCNGMKRTSVLLRNACMSHICLREARWAPHYLGRGNKLQSGVAKCRFRCTFTRNMAFKSRMCALCKLNALGKLGHLIRKSWNVRKILHQRTVMKYPASQSELAVEQKNKRHPTQKTPCSIFGQPPPPSVTNFEVPHEVGGHWKP